MKTRLAFYFSFCLFFPFFSIQILAQSDVIQPPKYLVVKIDGKYGYVNWEGKTTIPAQFLAAHFFSEGLAAVRTEKGYAYVDSLGNFALPPKYDGAEDFKNGVAKVYIKGKPYLIDTKGKILFEHSFRELDVFYDLQRVLITTYSGKSGIVDFSGKKVVDTLYAAFPKNFNEYFIFSEHNPYPLCSEQYDSIKQNSTQALINANGVIIVPFGKYKNILFVEKEGFYGNDFKDKKIKIDVQMNNWVHDNTQIEEIKINQWRSNQYFLIEKNKPLFYHPYDGGEDSINIKDLFTNDALLKLKDSLIIVSKIIFNENGWTKIDTTVNITDIIKQNKFLLLEGTRWGDYLFFHTDFIKNHHIKYVYNEFWNLKENIYYKHKDFFLGRLRFLDNVVLISYDDKMAYFHKNGTLIWEGNIREENELFKLNLREKISFSNFHQTTEKIEYNFVNNHDESNDKILKLIKEKFVPNESLGIYLETKEVENFCDKFQFMDVFIINPTQDTMFLPFENQQLWLQLEAQDAAGNWFCIDEKESFCNNYAFDITALISNQYWKLRLPSTDGAFKTKIRAACYFYDNFYEQRLKKIYSNEIEANIDPRQLFYHSTDHYHQVMDIINLYMCY